MIKISTSSNLNFKAVNSYYLKRAKEEHALMKGCSGDLLEDLMYDVFMRKIPTQDGIETLNAIKPYTQNIKQFIAPVEEAFIQRANRDKKRRKVNE